MSPASVVVVVVDDESIGTTETFGHKTGEMQSSKFPVPKKKEFFLGTPAQGLKNCTLVTQTLEFYVELAGQGVPCRHSR